MTNAADIDSHPVVVGITGASGSLIALHTIDALLDNRRSRGGIGVLCGADSVEAGDGGVVRGGTRTLGWTRTSSAITRHPKSLRQSRAAHFPTRGMALAPCSMATVAAVSQGLADNLIRRAADVTIKERRPLVVIPRESPLSIIHLENLTRLATLGATIIPPEPAFYLRQQTIEDVAKYAAQRTLLALGVISELPDGMRYGEG